MNAAGWTSGVLLALALATGTVSDVPRANPPVMRNGYRVLAVDFHVHGFPSSWATLAPWDLVLEARRQGLDAIVVAGHNNVWTGKLGRWFSRLAGGPTVLAGEEIVSPRYHMIAAGIDRGVEWNQPAASAIAEVHRQGGIAIAAHPTAAFWPAWDEAAVRMLDGTEVLQPISYLPGRASYEVQEFYERAKVAAIGDSDYHGLGPMGLCRTRVLARDNSENAILEAVRAGRTSAERGPGPDTSAAAALSRACALLGLSIALIWKPKRPPEEVR
ncbi:MAG TPA: PHP-associated domain-containing protein [Verrucomicrobiae bacterium]|nr:PHP-associated domain-containing protein [Verrucomicrobiae bacterium]